MFQCTYCVEFHEHANGCRKRPTSSISRALIRAVHACGCMHKTRACDNTAYIAYFRYYTYYFITIFLTGDILFGDIMLAIFCWRYLFRELSTMYRFYCTSIMLIVHTLCNKTLKHKTNFEDL